MAEKTLQHSGTQESSSTLALLLEEHTLWNRTRAWAQEGAVPKEQGDLAPPAQGFQGDHHMVLAQHSERRALPREKRRLPRRGVAELRSKAEAVRHT
jgi:hypothetical protein